jgi:4-amino-4-deoxy-L-arabinose transferase-like glycosyltransferase
MRRDEGILSKRTVLAAIDARIYAVGIVMFGLLMAFASRYGFHRDELYFLDCARHLSAAYVDQPVLTPLAAWVSLHLFGVSVVGLRLWGAVAAFASVVLGGLLAREFGGDRFAQLLGALGVATAPAFLGSDHLLETTSFDLLLWLALALVFVRIGRTGDTRLFVPAGLILGVGLANKHSIGFFALAVLAGLLLSGGSRLVVNRWCAAGAVVALLFTVPDLWWQATHGWATIDMTRSLAHENGGLGNAISFLFSQIFMASPVLIPVWLLGLRALWASEVPMWRALAWAYGFLIVFFALTSGAKPYYVAALYPILIAAGAVGLERHWSSAAEAPRRTRRLRSLAVGLTISVLVTLLFTLPVLPARTAGAFNGINTVPAETVGWPELVRSVAAVWHSLPAQQRAGAVIFTGNYGEAGAINELGRSEGLPPAVSAHNSEWFWGPGNPRATTVVAVLAGNVSSSSVRSFTRDFLTCRVAATIHNAEGVSNQEDHGHIDVCTGPRRSWAALWPSFRHYD